MPRSALVLLAFSCGVIAFSFAPFLPSIFWLLGLVPAAWMCFKFRPRLGFGIWLFWWVFAGASWGLACGKMLVARQLAPTLAEKTISIRGWVSGLPQQDEEKIRFLLNVDSADITEQQGPSAFPQLVQLSWYARPGFGAARNALPELQPGQPWELKVKLKRPRGFVNPDGFDYQAWLLRRGIGATGYVVSAVPAPATGVRSGWSAQVEEWRYNLQRWLLSRSHSSEKGILIALLIGDGGYVEKSQWLRMQQTGTSHLIAISGLHVGFLALAGYALGLLMGSALQLFFRRWPAQLLAYWCAIFCAAFYSALAGFNIPTVRTLIMLCVFYLASIWRRQTHLSLVYCVALALVVALDPLAAFDMGFWLSFGAVALLLVAFAGRYRLGSGRLELAGRVKSAWVGYVKSQWVMFVGLFIPLVLLVHSSPLLSPVANFISIPLVTFGVVPVLLLAAVTRSYPPLSDALLRIAEIGMTYLRSWLEQLLTLANGHSTPVLAFDTPMLVLLVIGSLVFILPSGLLPRAAGWFAIVLGAGASCLPQVSRAPLEINVLDVGQGTGVVVTTPHHQMLYDTGPAYSETFDGSGIILPFLHGRGLSRLDALVLSHWDLDHAGGLDGIFDALVVDRFYWGEPLRTTHEHAQRGESCHQAPGWRWDDVDFRFLRWPLHPADSANNHSCVLLITYRDQHILLPGDMESPVEWTLLRGDELPAPLTMLLAPHHGSRTSSNPGFVAYTKPSWVAYSAGYHNQHHHPHPQVQQRYAQAHSRQLNTAMDGALQFRWHADGSLTVSAARQTQRRYWFDPD